MRVLAEVIGRIDSHGYELKGFAGGPEGELYVLVASKWGEPLWRVLCFAHQSEWEYTITDGQTSFHHAQPMPEGILLCNGRQKAQSPNARIYNTDGSLIRELCLGDGIQDLQTTSSGDIWVSYFDEGVFGSTVASAGLARFDAQGKQTYGFQPNAELDWIADCYALNVDNSDQVWFYYYTPFPLVRLRRGVIDGIWRPGIAGAHAFAIFGDRIVMHSGYSQQDWRLLSLNNDGSATDLGALDCLGEDGEPLPASSACARSHYIWFVHGSIVYRMDLREIK